MRGDLFSERGRLSAEDIFPERSIDGEHEPQDWASKTKEGRWPFLFDLAIHLRTLAADLEAWKPLPGQSVHEDLVVTQGNLWKCLVGPFVPITPLKVLLATDNARLARNFSEQLTAHLPEGSQVGFTSPPRVHLGRLDIDTELDQRSTVDDQLANMMDYYLLARARTAVSVRVAKFVSKDPMPTGYMLEKNPSTFSFIAVLLGGGGFRTLWRVPEEGKSGHDDFHKQCNFMVLVNDPAP